MNSKKFQGMLLCNFSDIYVHTKVLSWLQFQLEINILLFFVSKLQILEPFKWWLDSALQWTVWTGCEEFMGGM